MDEVGCQFCFIVYVPFIEKGLKYPRPSFAGSGKKMAMELTCIYQANIGSMCPEVVRHAKYSIDAEAVKNNEQLLQYLNTPSCGGSSFKKR